MPTVSEIKSSRSHKKFEKTGHRPWDEGGTKYDKKDLFIKKVNPNLIRKWEFKDRHREDMGNISSLAKEFQEIGQQQPCIVRPINDEKYTYELIAGERRWLAAIESKMDLLVIEKNISDFESALIQIAENESREGLSDYTKGISFSRLIDQGLIKQKDIIEKLNKSKQYVSALLSFSKIPPDIMKAIKNPQNISAGTAAKIKQMSQKGDDYKKAIISLADRISSGKVGWEKLEVLVKNLVEKPSNTKKMVSKKISIDGRHILSIKIIDDGIESIQIEKNIVKMMRDANVEKLTAGEEIAKLILSKIV